jgi:hypothetical protein
LNQKSTFLIDNQSERLYCHPMLTIENTKTAPKVTGSNIGRFEIPSNHFSTPEGLRALTMLFDGMLVLRCERRQSQNSFGDVYEYMAIMPGFAVVPEGCQVPFYLATVKCVDSIPESITWVNDTVNKVVARMTESQECEPMPAVEDHSRPVRRKAVAKATPF